DAESEVDHGPITTARSLWLQTEQIRHIGLAGPTAACAPAIADRPATERTSQIAPAGARGSVGNAETQVAPGTFGGDRPPRRTGKKPGPYQERLAHLLHRVRLLANGDREGGQPDRPAAERPDEGPQYGPVQPVETDLVDVVDLERGPRRVEVDDPLRTDL